MDIAVVGVVAVSLLLGVTVGWLLASRAALIRMREQEARLRAEADSQAARLRTDLATAQGEINRLLSDREGLALEKSRAKTLEERLEPVREALEGLRAQTQKAAVERAEADSALKQQIEGVQRNYVNLEVATRQLVLAMTSSQSRGQWGEMQLERVLDYAGLVEGIHYRTQQTQQGDAGTVRPDVIVDLPGGGEIHIDAKFPFDSYWKAIQVEDSGAVGADDWFSKHATDVLARAKELASKRYSSGTRSADFVIMFMPFESLLSSAIDADSELLHKAFSRNVTIATPTSLLPMLRTIAFGYDRKLMADNAEEIKRAGAEMLSRLETAAGYLAKLRKGLDGAVKGYNEFVGSFDSRVMVQARKLQEMGVAAGTDIHTPPDLTEALRDSRAIEDSRARGPQLAKTEGGQEPAGIGPPLDSRLPSPRAPNT